MLLLSSFRCVEEIEQSISIAFLRVYSQYKAADMECSRRNYLDQLYAKGSILRTRAFGSTKCGRSLKKCLHLYRHGPEIKDDKRLILC